MHQLWPIYQCHGQQLAFLTDCAVSSQRLFCLVIRSKCQHASCLASYELFSSLIAQLVQRRFHGMLSRAEILPRHIDLLVPKNASTARVTCAHLNTDYLLHVAFKIEMFLLPVRRILTVTALPNLQVFKLMSILWTVWETR